jgi:hypothetical protein
MINYETIYVMISNERWRGYIRFWMVQHNDWNEDDEIISCTCRNILNSLTHKFPLCDFWSCLLWKKISTKELK